MTRSALLLLVCALAVPAGAAAQEWTPPGEPESEREAAPESADEASGEVAADDGAGGARLARYMELLAERRLLAEELGSVDRLRRLVIDGEQLFLDERYDESALRLFEVAESPQFADFVDLDEFRGAEYMLARALERLGALRTAQRYLFRIIERGAEDIYFGPAFRKLVDVALAGGDPQRVLARIEETGVELTEDAENERSYLIGRFRYDADDFPAAEEALGEISRRSRFFASAQYLRGVMAARQGDLQTAEDHFCSIATTGNEDRFTFFVDDRYFEVKDLAHLALGRVAHEGGRSDDAFYYYFQVPQDSERVAEALFESAYAMYEGGDYETAIDLLDQLDVRFPNSQHADEAALLRGYVHLGRCEFEEASRLFVRFQGAFGPVLAEVDRILENPARQERLFAELLDEEQRLSALRDSGEEESESAKSLLLAMLRVDPDFYRLHANVRVLDAEAARAGRLATDLQAIANRVRGENQPRAASEREEDTWDEAGEIRTQLADGQAILGSLTQQLDEMRRADAPRDQLQPLEQEIRQLGTRLRTLERQLDEAMAAAGTDDGVQPGSGDDIESMLRSDVRHARGLPSRIAATRARMVEAGNELALLAVRDLKRRLGGGLRRARIGRIDAVMGSKRRIEIQIESLAAGRFPPELQDPLRVQGLLRDDEEYWPFEGEYWADEFDETDPIDEVLEEEAEALEEEEEEEEE